MKALILVSSMEDASVVPEIDRLHLQWINNELHKTMEAGIYLRSTRGFFYGDTKDSYAIIAVEESSRAEIEAAVKSICHTYYFEHQICHTSLKDPDTVATWLAAKGRIFNVQPNW